MRLICSDPVDVNYILCRPLNLICLLIVTAILFGCYNTSPIEEKTLLSEQAAPVNVRVNSIGLKQVYITGGSFLMGDARFLDARPVHRVKLSSFWIGQYEVTNAEFELFKKRPRPPESLTDSQPATSILWTEAVEYCEWLSKKEGRRYRLPTEAEWEYAARGGLEQKDYPWGNESPDGRATFGLQAETTPVGSYAPNAYGLYDLAGNVSEWVWDWYNEDYYAKSPIVDPQGPHTGEWKITRGGSFDINELYCAQRLAVPPRLTSVHNGFRIVAEADSNTY